MKISVIGTGIYGLAIANSLAKKDNKIVMWTEKEKIAKEFKETKKIASIIDVAIPKNITVSTDMSAVLANSDLIYMVTASKYVNSVCDRMQEFYDKRVPICIATKGIEESSEELLSNIVAKKLKTKHIAVISGPTFAVDILHDEPVALALGSSSLKAKNLVLKTLPNEHLKLRPTKDMIGIQICGSVKNVIAIAAGIVSGLGYSESTRSFLINESLHDIKDIITYLGGNPKTILSFAGVGDLMLTCSSTKSRNFSFGYVIGSTKDAKKIKEYLINNTVEGYYTLDTIYRLLKKRKITIKLINVIYDIVYHDNSPEKLTEFLIAKK